METTTNTKGTTTMTTTVTLTADEMATILAALRVANTDAHDRLFAAQDRDACPEVQAFIAADIDAVRSVTKRLQFERQSQLGLAGQSLIGPAR